MPADYSALRMKDRLEATRRGYIRKGYLLLSEGRLTVTRVIPEQGIYEGTVRGDHDTYTVAWDKNRMRYTCTCPSYGPCSHSWAFQSVVSAREAEL